MKFQSDLIDVLRNAGHIVVFTGAGVSKESGIATFRDKSTGLWEQYDVKALSTVDSFKKDPALVWGWYEWLRAEVMLANPNAAHIAIAQMAQHVSKLTVITQNVDDLHERAGSTNVLHLHGNLSSPYCFACKRSHSLTPGVPVGVDGSRLIEPPRCENCGAFVRPDVVWFGENLSTEIWDQAVHACERCDVLFSIGTSAEVFPAATLPTIAATNGSYIIQVNPTPTPLNQRANRNLRGKAGVVMPALYEAVWNA